VYNIIDLDFKNVVSKFRISVLTIFVCL